jgi:hypothetical protein
MTDDAASPHLVLLEFTGLGTEGTFRRAVPDRRTCPPQAIDPLIVSGHRDDVEGRAATIAQAVLATSATDIVLAGSCSGSVLLAPVADLIIGAGRNVVATVAVDPGPVTDSSLDRTLADLATTLGCPPARPDGGWTFDSADRRLQGWIERYIGDNDLDTEMQEIVRSDLYERYRSWLGYLFAAHRRQRSGITRPVTVFTVRDSDLKPVFGDSTETRVRKYRFDGRPGLARPDLAQDFQAFLATLRWPGSPS